MFSADNPVSSDSKTRTPHWNSSGGVKLPSTCQRPQTPWCCLTGGTNSLFGCPQHSRSRCQPPKIAAAPPMFQLPSFAAATGTNQPGNAYPMMPISPLDNKPIASEPPETAHTQLRTLLPATTLWLLMHCAYTCPERLAVIWTLLAFLMKEISR